MGSLTYGSGAYSNAQGVVTSENIDGGMGTDVPIFTGGPNTITVSHREYITDVYAPTQAAIFSNQTYALNPALVQTFPWLSQIAGNYEEYTFKQLIYTFRSNVTDFVSANGQVGTITMAVQYNANDDPFPTKQDAMEYDGAVSGKVSEKAILCGVECDPAQNSGPAGKYCRPGPAAPGEDLKTFDLGTLNFMVSNTPPQFNNQALGELWVSYTVELRKPKFLATRGLAIQKDVWVGQQAAKRIDGTPLAGTIDEMVLGEGQQNRIGGLLVTSHVGTGTTLSPQFPATSGTLYYVLPSTFSGNVQFDIHANSDDLTLGPQGARAYIDVVPVTGTSELPVLAVAPINDIYSNGHWVSAVTACASGLRGDSVTGTYGGNTSTISTWHFAVIPPTSAASATETVFSIDMKEGWIVGSVPPALYTSLYVAVSVYNTGLNQHGRPVIQNPDTQLVESWP